jgi:hypothetical protein
MAELNVSSFELLCGICVNKRCGKVDRLSLIKLVFQINSTRAQYFKTHRFLEMRANVAALKR